MKFHLRFRSRLLLLAAFLALVAAGTSLHAQSATTEARPAAAAQSGNGEQQAEGGENNQFRHAPKVRWIARIFHIDIETAAQIFEDVNSGVLILVILFFAAKFLSRAIRNRTASIQKQLVEARTATEMANERLSAVEAKLARLGEDIDAIRQQAERDALEDEKRIKQGLEDERVRIVKSAEQEIESAGTAAQRQLKRFAAELAIDRAVARIQLSAESDKAIIERFGSDLAGQISRLERN